MILGLLLIVFSISFGVCPPGLNVSLDLSAETVEKEGRQFRRADVLVFIPVDRESLRGESPALASRAKVLPLGEESYEVKILLRNVSDRVVEGAYLEQEIGTGASPPESIEASKVLSRKPLIFEPVSLYPTDLREGTLVVKLPPLKPGEEMEISYLISSKEKPAVPQVRGVPPVPRDKRDRVYMLVAKYSFLFGYGRTRTSDMNLDNLREVLEGFRRAGLKPVVKIRGIADGRTRNPKRNAEVASKRARFVAERVLGENYACYVRRGFAENVR